MGGGEFRLGSSCVPGAQLRTALFAVPFVAKGKACILPDAGPKEPSEEERTWGDEPGACSGSLAICAAAH